LAIQAFVDDSGGKGSTPHFVLAGLIGGSESWAEFSEEWAAALREPPAIPLLKMSHAGGKPTGHFRFMSERERDAKLRRLARVLNQAPRIATYSVIDLEAHAKTWATQARPHSEPYFWPYQNTIMAVCHTLWESGWRERFEIIYDIDVIFGPRARHWYPFIRRLMEIKFPEEATILPVDPMFRSDDEFLPLQAADLFAWCARDSFDKKNDGQFAWLFEEFINIRGTIYSQYYDLERMTAVMAESQRLFAEGNISPDLTNLYAELSAQARRK
jgi:hypothetical protein